MSVLIGHASIDERGAAAGGSAGDQTGKEVCKRGWYDKGWNVLLRPANPSLAEKSAQACEAACENSSIGYDQSARNTLFDRAKAVSFDLSKIDTPCACDCSSLMHVCAIAGGADIPYEGNGCTTRTMVRAFLNSGDYIKLTGREYLSAERALRRGDILVKEGSHTVMVLQGGQPLPPAAEDTTVTAEVCTLRLPVLYFGSTGEPVRAMQQLLLAKGYDLPRWGDDGEFGGETERALLELQADGCLKDGGVCDCDSWCTLLGVGVG